MIHFQCWSCNQAHEMPESCAGERIPCACGSLLRVPADDGGDCRVQTLAGRLKDRLHYAGWGAVCGFAFGVSVLLPGSHSLAAILISVFVPALVGLLIGLLVGERGFLWLGNIVVRIVERDKKA